MKDLELNKISAAILLAGIIAMVMGFITEALYHPIDKIAKRGYQIEGISDDAGPVATTQEFQWPEMAIGKLMAAADADNGANVFKKCSVCHDISKGGPHRVGPNLWNTMGLNKGGHENYSYSKAMIQAGGKWDYEDLFKFLHSPKNYIKGTKMGFAGLSKDTDIADVIAFLRQHDDNPPALPALDLVYKPATTTPAEAKPTASTNIITDSKPATKDINKTESAKPVASSTEVKPLAAPATDAKPIVKDLETQVKPANNNKTSKPEAAPAASLPTAKSVDAPQPLKTPTLKQDADLHKDSSPKTAPINPSKDLQKKSIDQTSQHNSSEISEAEHQSKTSSNPQQSQPEQSLKKFLKLDKANSSVDKAENDKINQNDSPIEN